MVINKNLRALNVVKIAKYQDWEVDKRTEKVATGLRINHASDDASGLAVSEKMIGQLHGLRQAERNTEDGLSLVQTAEGYLSEASNILRRIRTLAIQASNSTYSNSERMHMQLEVSQLADEIDRIASSAHFNNQRLFTGDLSRHRFKMSMYIQRGPNQFQRDRIYIGTMTAQALNLRTPSRVLAADVRTENTANETVGLLDNAIRMMSQQRADLGGYQVRYEQVARNLMSTYASMNSQASVMRDADVAEEIMELTRGRILASAANAQLAQANFSTSLMALLIEKTPIFG